MRIFRLVRGLSAERGQSLIEAALILPLLFLLLFNAINFAWFFYVALNLAQAPRDAVEFAIQGSATPAQLAYAPAGPSSNTYSVSYVAYQNLTHGLPNATNSPVRVCTVNNGLSNPILNVGTTTQVPACVSFGNTYSFPAPAADPEAPAFLLYRVDVVYTVAPLIPGSPFGITLLPNYTLHRQVSMRAM